MGFINALLFCWSEIGKIMELLVYATQLYHKQSSNTMMPKEKRQTK